MGASQVYEWEWQLPAPPERAWPLVSDTQRVNKAAGLGPWEFHSAPDPRGGTKRTGAFRFMRLPIEWEEHPFEWIAPRELSVVRSYTAGPLVLVRSRVTLEAHAGGTRLR